MMTEERQALMERTLLELINHVGHLGILVDAPSAQLADLDRMADELKEAAS